MFTSGTALSGSGRRKLHEQIAYDIGVSIARGVYREGDLLPTELTLAENYRVSRTAVREAFRILAAKGMTLSRPKIGTRVRNRSQWNMLDTDVLAWHIERQPDPVFVAALFELREMIEPEAAATAALRRDERQLQAMETAVSAIRRAATIDELAKAIFRFHETILDAVRNPLVRSLGTLIEAIMHWTLQLEFAKAGDNGEREFLPVSVRHNLVSRHAKILDAIRDGDADRAREGARAVLVRARDDVLSSLAERRPD